MIMKKQVLIAITLILIFLSCWVPSELLGQENNKKTNDNDSGISKEFREYLIKANKEVQKNWRLPKEAKFPEKTEVIIAISVNRNGEITNVKMEKKSNDEYFNKLVLETVKKVNPLPPLPATIKQEQLEIGLRFTPNPQQSDDTKADAYYDYVADLHLHESNQARNPKHVIHYTEGEEGRHLKSVLDPLRLKEVLNTCSQSTEHGKRIANLTSLLGAVYGRYGEAFKQQPNAYESEYLDSLEDLVTLQSAAGMNFAMALSPKNRPQEKTETKQKAITESAEALAKSMHELTATINRRLAAEIRNEIAKGLFTNNGAKRALAIADRLAPH